MDSMRWNEELLETSNSHASTSSAASAPTIKNHSVTHLGQHLFCFGGYDGRRNHMTLLLYHLVEKRWILPQLASEPVTNNGNEPPGHYPNGDSAMMMMMMIRAAGTSSGPINPSSQINHLPMIQPPPIQRPSPMHHSLIVHNGPQGRLHQPLVDESAIVVVGNPPPGRNGHSATLAADDEDIAERNGRIIIIGGWLGTGPLAASDMHVLDVSRGGRLLTWYQPSVRGTPPGPCNMHSADYVKSLRSVYVFRGGNGREYLNDLHSLDIDTFTWKLVETKGPAPQQRANHSSAVLDETNELFIFGGWNGGERLNDIHILNISTSTWTCPRVGGVLPHPRAGMTLTALRGRLYLFGGSGTSAKCFQDLQILDRQQMAWIDVTQCEEVNGNNMNSTIQSIAPVHHHHHHHQQEQIIHQHHLRIGVGEDDVLLRFGGAGNAGTISSHQPHLFLDEAPPQQQQYGGDMMLDETYSVASHPAQDGSSLHNSFRDWRTRDTAIAPHPAGRSISSMSAVQRGSINPNDEDAPPTIFVYGRGPGRRAGHTATCVNRKIYVFGGSCGSDYLNDFFVLDTDPPPRAVVTEATSLQLLERRLRHFFNDPEFADVIFLVQGQKLYGHKMILSIASDCFRAMFTTGFRETSECEIEIPDCTYAGFLSVMEYMYTSQLPVGNSESLIQDVQLGHHMHPGSSFARIVEMLELADRFFLDHLKQVCETLLQPAVNGETVDYLLATAQKTNALQLQVVCEHYVRNRE